MRRELLDQLEGERRGWEGEREMMKKEVTRLGKELEEGKASRRQLATTQGELNKSQQRLGVGASDQRIGGRGDIGDSRKAYRGGGRGREGERGGEGEGGGGERIRKFWDDTYSETCIKRPSLGHDQVVFE